MSKRQDFIKRVQEKTDLSKKETEQVIDAVFEALQDTLVETGEASVGDLGKLRQVKRAARKGRNPATGDEILIGEKQAVKYTASKSIKEAIN